MCGRTSNGQLLCRLARKIRVAWCWLLPPAPEPGNHRRPCGCVARDRPRLRRQKTATLTMTLHGNPIEHGNIRVIETGGQARHCAIRLRYHDLRMCDRR